jgi:hypothetical protein
VLDARVRQKEDAQDFMCAVAVEGALAAHQQSYFFASVAAENVDMKARLIRVVEASTVKPRPLPHLTSAQPFVIRHSSFVIRHSSFNVVKLRF